MAVSKYTADKVKLSFPASIWRTPSEAKRRAFLLLINSSHGFKSHQARRVSATISGHGLWPISRRRFESRQVPRVSAAVSGHGGALPRVAPGVDAAEGGQVAGRVTTGQAVPTRGRAPGPLGGTGGHTGTGTQ